MKYKLSIIIPFFFSDNEDIDSKRYFSLLAFEKCLKAVFKSQYKKFEVIAVSDGSSNDLVEIAKKYPCKIIKIQKNSGAAFSRNVGAKKAKGQILVFLDLRCRN
ncbi:glycosyltransferase family A protein [Candidatus Pelagibacter sp. Uisw_104]|uniref:glycosyltransferase family A protein n=1 Tax=Candidatus Pelagibacter sp. Uisw_104 TaxID=3230983 RepID=UPI0039E929A7